MNTVPNPKASYITEYVIAVGYLLFFCVILTLCSTFYYFDYVRPQPVPVNAFATGLPPTTLTPHILLTDQLHISEIFKDDFSNDSHGWNDFEETSKAEVSLGKLLFGSEDEGYYSYTTCGLCPYLAKPFYMQADFSTGSATDKGFGIYFNYDSDKATSFLFGINTEARSYYLYHDTDEGWSLRATGESSQIKSFPAVNTVGIYAAKDFVEFYINGKIIDSYHETGYSFYKGDFGFFVDDSDFKLVVDNLIINGTGK